MAPDDSEASGRDVGVGRNDPRSARRAAINTKSIVIGNTGAPYPHSGNTMFRVLTCLTVEHDWRLVVVAGIVCFIASLCAISLFHRALSSQGGATGVSSTGTSALGLSGHGDNSVRCPLYPR